MEYNRLLKRQLTKYLGDGLEDDPRLLPFIEAINDYYNAFERDKRLSEHAFEVSERDYLNIYSRLREEINIRNQSIQKLKETIRNMAPDAEDKIFMDGDSLLDVINYLNHQVNKRREAEAAMRLAKEEAEKAYQAKSEFLSVMSHEIRTPLNAVLGLVQLLLRQDPRPDQVSNMQVLKASAENLLALINDILDFSKINANKLEIDHAPFDIRKTVNDVFQAISIRGQESNNKMSITIDPKIPHLLYGDAHRLTQVLNNLLSNAVKFTHNGEVSLALSLTSRTASTCSVTFSVSDTGIGIEEDKVTHIFSPFSQASSSITRNFGGTGLGLAITSELLQLMHARVNVETELGKGSRFYFTLDMEYIQDEQDAQTPVLSNVHNLHGARVLLVEDTLFNVLFAKQLLEKWHCVVDVAENGAIAVEKMRAGSYDLVLMDLYMPVMDGYTAAREIRKFNTNTPMITLTATAPDDLRARVLAAGMQDYVIKPFDIDLLYGKMEGLLGAD